MERAYRRRIGWVALLVLALALLLAWWSAPVGAWREPAPGSTLERPSTSKNPAYADPTEVRPPAGPAASARLHVWVRDPRVARHVSNVAPEPFLRVWPQPGDPDWQLERLDGLQTVAELHLLEKPSRRLSEAHEVVAAAEAEGFAGPDADRSTPEAALVTLYAEWVRSEVAWTDAWDAFVAPHLAPGLAWPDLSNADRARILALDDRPFRDRSTLRDHAEEILARWPDHPIADHARFALVRVTQNSDDAPSTDMDRMATTILAIESEAVRTQAALVPVGMSSFLPATPALLDAVGSVTPSDPPTALRIGTWAMNRAVALGDWARADAWSARVRAVLDAHCGPDPAIREYSCTQGGYELRDAVGRLVGVGWTEPATWQEALTGEGWRCHLDAGHTGTARTTATFDGSGWRFGPWDAPTAATACLERVRQLAVDPDGPLEVALTYEGPPG